MRMRSRNQIVECKNRFRKLQSFFLRNPSPKLNEAFGRWSKWRKCFANEMNCLGKKYNFSIFLTFTFFKKIFLIFPLSLHWPVRSLLTLFFSISIVFVTCHRLFLRWFSHSLHLLIFPLSQSSPLLCILSRFSFLILSLSLLAFTSSSNRNLSLIVFFIYSLSLFLSSLGILTQSIFLPTRNPNFFNNTKKAKRPGLEFHLQPETSKATNGVSLPDADATFFLGNVSLLFLKSWNTCLAKKRKTNCHVACDEYGNCFG